MKRNKKILQIKIIFPLLYYLILLFCLRFIDIENILMKYFSVNRDLSFKIINQIGYIFFLVIPLFVLVDLIRRKRKYLELRNGISVTFFLSSLVGLVTGSSLGYGFCSIGHASNFFDFIAPCFFVPLVGGGFLTGLVGVAIDFVWKKLKPGKI